MSLGMGNYRQILVPISRYLSITTHTPPKNTGVVRNLGLSKMPLLTINYTTLCNHKASQIQQKEASFVICALKLHLTKRNYGLIL